MDTLLRPTQPTISKDLEETKRNDTKQTTSDMIGRQDHNEHLPRL